MTGSDWGPDSPAYKRAADVKPGQERSPRPASVAVSARTSVPADTEEQGGSAALRDDLSREHEMARVMDPNAHDDTFPMDPDRRVERLDSALEHAIAAIDAGYRLVSDDDTTVDRVARALCHVDGHLWPGDDADLVPDASTAWTVTGKPWRYRVAARAAVRALREEQ